MPQPANADTVNKDHQNIDYGKVLELIQTTIHGLESEQRSLSADAKDAWDRIENLGVNKVGAQLFSKMLKKPVDKRRDEFRTFIMLAKEAGWLDWLTDLVDVAELAGAGGAGRRDAPPPPQAAAAPPPPAPAGDKDLVEATDKTVTRVNLKTSMIERLKAGVTPEQNAASAKPDADWEDVRAATPAELAAERERLADFDVDGPKAEPEVAAAKQGARAKAGAKK